MTPALVRRVGRTIRRRALFSRGDRVAVALSGGADSVALLLLLRALAPRHGFDVVGAIHVNHGLREGEAAGDEVFCRALADRLALPLDSGAVDTRTRAARDHVSIETAARELREAFLTDAAARLGADVVATGHTADDQAETVLLRLLRGAGSRGVSGIRPRRGLFARPLIDCRRADLRAFLAASGEPHCEDSSNASLAFARNRIRRHLLPAIERLAPGGVPALARFASLAAADEAYLTAAAVAAAAPIVLFERGGVQVNRAALSSLAFPIARRVIRLALERAGVRRLSAAHIEAVRALAASKRSTGRVDVAAASVEARGERLLISTSAVLPARAGEMTLEVDVRPSLDGRVLESGRGDVAVVQAAAIEWPLAVRRRRPGDRFRPLGAPGTRKLKDVLIDRKIPRAERDRLAVVVDAAGHIVWVARVAIAHDCRVTKPAAKVVILTVRTT